MADCYFHGYSGGSGPCSECESERRRGLEPGTLSGEYVGEDAKHVMNAANISSIGRKAAAEMERKSKKKKKK